MKNQNMKTPRIRIGGNYGFTLIELLVVISIIGILAALLLPVARGVHQNMAKKRARTELQKVELAIGQYQAKLGHYPPDNPNNAAINQLYFELLGVKSVGTKFESLDGNGSIDSTPASIGNFYGNPQITGFVNSGASGDDSSSAAVKFLTELMPAQYLVWKNGGVDGAVLGTAVKGPLMFTNSVTGKIINPFRYNSSSPTNNINSFDLWVDIDIGGKTVRIANWSDTPINNP